MDDPSEVPIPSFLGTLPDSMERGASLEELYQDLLILEVNPMYAVEYFKHDLAQGLKYPPGRPEFLMIRLHELFGGLEIEHTDDYIRWFIATFGPNQELLKYFLRRDTEFRETEFWRIFEVVGGTDLSLAIIDGFITPEINGAWRTALSELVAEGTLDRAQMLRACLEALDRGFAENQAAWYRRTYIALAPTPEEVDQDQALLMKLLAAPTSGTVSFALDQAAVLQKAGFLDTYTFVQSVPPALRSTKKAAMAAVRLLNRGLPARQELDDVAQDAFVVALGHDHRDVQKAAAKSLLRWGCPKAVVEHLQELAPAVAAEMKELLPEDLLLVEDAPAQTDDAARVPVLYGLGDPVQAWPEDAVSHFQRLVTDDRRAVDLEMALDWLARNPGKITELQAVEKEADKVHQSTLGSGPSLILAGLAASGAGLRWTELDATGDSRYQALCFADSYNNTTPTFAERVDELLETVLQSGPARQLLAVPTSTVGWIDPAVLVHRVIEQENQTWEPLHYDVVQALLRISPYGRVAALRALAEAPAPSGSTPDHVASRDLRIVLGWALGADEEPTAVHAQWWAAANLARGTGATPALTKARLDSPGLGIEPRMTSTWAPLPDGYASSWLWPHVTGNDHCPLSPGFPALVHGGVGHHIDPWRTETFRATNFSQAALVYPPSMVPFIARAMLIVGDDDDQYRRRAYNTELMEILGEHPGVWGLESAKMLGLGLSSSVPQARTVAAQVLVDVVGRRISAQDMAAGMAQVAIKAKSTRWITALKEATDMGPQAQSVVADVLIALLPQLDRRTSRIGALMAMVQDDLVRRGRALSDSDLRIWLEGFKGSSQAAKTARALLKL